jgi:hypothetical protein
MRPLRFGLFTLAVWSGGCGSNADDSNDGGRGGTGGKAGSNARGGAGAGVSGTGGIVDCEGIDPSQSGVLDLDLAAVTVTGAVTLAGNALPDEAGSRGALLFQTADGRSSARVELGSTGAKNYALRLPPGIYEVSLEANAELCAWPNAPNMPCGGGRLVSRAALRTDGVLDVDIPVVSVSGNVTLEGSGLSETAKRGAVLFTASDSEAGGSVALPATGPAGYRINLLPGTYDVTFAGDPTECTGELPPAVPCNSGTLRSAVVLTSSRVLDLDLPTVRVTGMLTLNGTPPNTQPGTRGQLSFAGDTGAPVLTKPFVPSGAASYEVLLLPGEYDVSYVPSPVLCDGTFLPSMPCVGGTIRAEQDLSADGVLDVDVRAVTVTGAVTLNGAPLPGETADRGKLSFVNRVGGAGVTGDLQMTGTGQYSMRVLAGAYDIDFVANPALCATHTAPAMPCTGGSVGTNVMLEADGVFDVDLQPVRVAGSVTLNGAPMPAAQADRGTLTFSRGSSSVTTAAFGASGAAEYALSLWPGIYRVAFDANAAACGAGLPAPPVPCGGGTLRSDASLTVDGVLDLDVRTVTVSGSVTLLGAPLPTATLDRGAIEIAHAGEPGIARATVELGTDSPPSYAATLIAGSYVFLHAANADLCTGSDPAPAIPCASQALLGCPPPP